MEKTEGFGPFIKVPTEIIKFAGWPCRSCRKPVRRIGMHAPGLVPRLLIYSCLCGSIGVWEDENQPNEKLWAANMQLLRETGAAIALFNGNKPTPPGFSGMN